jgi:hypothetical protein
LIKDTLYDQKSETAHRRREEWIRTRIGKDFEEWSTISRPLVIAIELWSGTREELGPKSISQSREKEIGSGYTSVRGGKGGKVDRFDRVEKVARVEDTMNMISF